MVGYTPALGDHRVMDVSRLMNPNGSFSILALDGGGIREIYAAQLLAKVEQSLGTKIADCFDLISGTITGSIMAGAAVAEIAMTDIVNLFENETSSIFRKRSFITDLSAWSRSSDVSRTVNFSLTTPPPRNNINYPKINTTGQSPMPPSKPRLTQYQRTQTL